VPIRSPKSLPAASYGLAAQVGECRKIFSRTEFPAPSHCLPNRELSEIRLPRPQPGLASSPIEEFRFIVQPAFRPLDPHGRLHRSWPFCRGGHLQREGFRRQCRKTEDARPALQKAIEACAAAGGGTVYLPPGQYTSGTLRLRSHVGLELAQGATLFASPAPADYPCRPGPLPGPHCFPGKISRRSRSLARGRIDGQAAYEWREDDFEQGFEHKTRMMKLGKSLARSFPKGFPRREFYPHLIWLGRTKGVQVSGLRLVHSPSWTVALYACERVVFTNLFVQTSLRDGCGRTGLTWMVAATYHLPLSH